MMRVKTLALAVAFASLAVPPAFADREPTPGERVRIQSALMQQGFHRWDDIELVDGLCLVEDAVIVNGQEYDLKLDPYTLAIVARD